jgi:hypothetical protein
LILAGSTPKGASISHTPTIWRIPALSTGPPRTAGGATRPDVLVASQGRRWMCVPCLLRSPGARGR